MSDDPTPPLPIGRSEQIADSEPRNLLVLAVHQIVVRVAWIFKTESVIMPAFLDAIAGAGWVRGWLPVLNRIGQSVPPLLLADQLRAARRKKVPHILTSLCMGLPFLTLAFVWSRSESRPAWLPAFFLLLYLTFFAIVGINQMAFGTVQGKLIAPRRRGRLLWISTLPGSLLAVLAAWLLLGRWLELPNHTGYGPIFAFTGAGFCLAGLVLLALVEPDDGDNEPGRLHLTDPFRDAWSIYRSDSTFRRAAHVAMLFIGAMFLFPHYQWLGRSQLGTQDIDLLYWVIAQNIGVGLFSPIAGVIADRYGNRLAMRGLIFVSAGVPLLALLISSPLFAGGADLFWIVFFFLGVSPIAMRTIFNYTLELVDEEHHPRYLSTMRVCFAVPFLVSPLAGLFLDLFGDENRYLGACLLFSFVSGLVLFGGVLTFGMDEPRHAEGTSW